MAQYMYLKNIITLVNIITSTEATKVYSTFSPPNYIWVISLGLDLPAFDRLDRLTAGIGLGVVGIPVSG